LRAWHAPESGPASVFHGDRGAPRRTLGAGALDDGPQAMLRAAALQLDEGIPMPRLDHHDLLSLVSTAVATGWLRVGGPPPALMPLVGARAAAVAPPAPRPAAPPRRTAAVAAPVAEGTFGADVDVAAMVAALTRAAADGVPFCEECAKAAARRGRLEASA
jgi:hypothetical protein